MGTSEPDYTIPGVSPLDAPEVNVDVTNLVSYFDAMRELALGVQMEFLKMTEGMQTMAQAALLPSVNGGPWPLAEFGAANSLLNGRVQTFGQFFNDVRNGLTNIGSAAVVVAEIYANADNDSAANLKDIGFAFGDYDATRPSHFGYNTKTISALADEQAQKNGANAEAVSYPDDLATKVEHTDQYTTVFTFADGSKRVVRLAVAKNELAAFDTSTTTSYYGPGGKFLSSQTKAVANGYDGSTTTVTTDETGDATDGATTTHTTVMNSDGSASATTSTETRTNGTKTVTTTDPVTVAPSDPGTTGQAQPGPQQQTVELLGDGGPYENGTPLMGPGY